MGLLLKNPHETLLVLFGRPWGLKGLSYVLSATVIPTKVSLRFYCFSVVLFCFCSLVCSWVPRALMSSYLVSLLGTTKGLAWGSWCARFRAHLHPHYGVESRHFSLFYIFYTRFYLVLVSAVFWGYFRYFRRFRGEKDWVRGLGIVIEEDARVSRHSRRLR